ncbi:FAD-binding oxidoreductase [Klenkia sp. PcliD-1-E]|uniref:NAD(P)/FAD-dependent oxidoreductase n=1 Tax=Klenkia sp. PcliD-1-E TaxID=2954492 RepID=UPI0020980620|nr:FAD-dependent oxidoreductase [Klenkia sp. PcliD-1-E]MCO7220594.1 FAD-binding oxidoreductase [Klenkia sp. PcliD-1-E]
MSTADVVVVGAGIVGAAAAHRLSVLGHRVVVLDSGVPNGQGSGASAANVHVQGIHTRRPGQAVPVDVERLLPLQREARARWTHLSDELDADVGFCAAGGVMVAETEEQVADLHRKHAWETAAGVATEVLDGDTARKALPLLGPGVRAATWCPADGYADPASVAPAYLAAATRAGAAVLAHHPVHRMEHAGGAWTVHAAGSTWNAPVVLDAAGPWMGRVAELVGVVLAMAPVAIQALRLSAGPVWLPHLVQHVGEGFSVKQDPAGRTVLGGGWPALPWSLDDQPRPDPASTTGNLGQLARVVPALAGLPVEHVWSGPLAATPDEMPVAGWVPGRPGLLAVGGTYSFTLAPLWADVVAALVEGREPPVDLTGLDPGRLVRTAVPTPTPQEEPCG